jgi:DNA-binding MarR family transcriptional regulator
VTELAVLQAVRLKGRVTLADLAATLGEDGDDVAVTVERLARAGMLVNDKALRLSPDGRARLQELLAAERQHIDQAAIAAAYAEFRSVNAEFKELVGDWQVKQGQPNTHDDVDYDADVLERLDDVHRRTAPVLAAAAAQLPRLDRYRAKLQAALDKVHAGDTMWLSRPLIDSYHTVWFELHEELIIAVGLTRESEARSGDAS